MNNNYLLSKAKSGGHIGTMSFAMTWIKKSNPNQQWSWTLTKHLNTGDGAISNDRKFWTIQGYGDTTAAVYPVIISKKA